MDVLQFDNIDQARMVLAGLNAIQLTGGANDAKELIRQMTELETIRDRVRELVEKAQK